MGSRRFVPEVSDTDYFDDLEDTGYAAAAQGPVEAPVDGLRWAKPESTFDVSQVKPHNCMSDIVQRGNYLHCNVGNHGMRIPAGKILTKDKQGNWDLIDMVVLEPKKKAKRTKAVAEG